MKQIIKNLFVGDWEDGKKALSEDFTVVSMCKECPVGHRSILKYHTLAAPHDENYYFVVRGKHFAANLIDVDNPDFIPEAVINPALKFIEENYKKGEKVLIHCEKGHSRGPTTCFLFLRTIGEMPHTFIRAEKIFRTLYPLYDPGVGMRSYARTHWKELENVNVT